MGQKIYRPKRKKRQTKWQQGQRVDGPKNTQNKEEEYTVQRGRIYGTKRKNIRYKDEEYTVHTDQRQMGQRLDGPKNAQTKEEEYLSIY